MHYWKQMLSVGLLLGLSPYCSAYWGGPRVGIGIGIGVPFPGYYYPPPYYYAPPVVVTQPPPIVVTQPAPATTVLQPVNPPVPAAPYSSPAPMPSGPPAPMPEPIRTMPRPLTPTSARETTPEQGAAIDRWLLQLSNADDRSRAAAAIALGRQRANQAVEPLQMTLANDRSPQVREAAARGLGLIGAPSSLPALQTAAQSDDDRDVRNSARFAAEVIRSRQ